MKTNKWAIKITEENLQSIIDYRNFNEQIDARTKFWIGKYMTESRYFSAKKPQKYPIITKIP